MVQSDTLDTHILQQMLKCSKIKTSAKEVIRLDNDSIQFTGMLCKAAFSAASMMHSLQSNFSALITYSLATSQKPQHGSAAGFVAGNYPDCHHSFQDD